MNSRPNASPNPTGEPPLDDARLMMMLDGELSAEEQDELERALESMPEVRGKLTTLDAVGAVLRHTAESDTRGDGIADAVMAAIDAEDASRGGQTSANHVNPPGKSAHSAELRMAEPALRSRTTANDNARSIFGVAALAAAAAAALFVWGRTQPTDMNMAFGPLPEAPLAAAPLAGQMPKQLAIAPIPSGPSEQEAANDASENTPVEVASIEFGTRDGSVFYVPGDGVNTTVVWINDAGEEQ